MQYYTIVITFSLPFKKRRVICYCNVLALSVSHKSRLWWWALCLSSITFPIFVKGAIYLGLAAPGLCLACVFRLCPRFKSLFVWFIGFYVGWCRYRNTSFPSVSCCTLCPPFPVFWLCREDSYSSYSSIAKSWPQLFSLCF